MDELDKKELIDAYNKVARNVCQAISTFEYDRDRYKLDKACERLFKRGKDLELQARQNGFKFVGVPPSPNKTGTWAVFELQEIDRSTCN